jgi:mercuric ion binding protein
MKTRILLITAIFGLGLITNSCGDSDDGKEEEEKKEEAYVKGAKLNIEGMTCSVGCAGTIEKEMGKTDGVSSCEVEFEDKIAHIKFNPNTISEKEIVEKIEAMNGGQYKVTELNVDASESSAAEEPKEMGYMPKRNKGSLSNHSKSRDFSFLNVFDILSSIF